MITNILKLAVLLMVISVQALPPNKTTPTTIFYPNIEICNLYNGRRIYLELGEHGQIEATNVSVPAYINVSIKPESIINSCEIQWFRLGFVYLPARRKQTKNTGKCRGIIQFINKYICIDFVLFNYMYYNAMHKNSVSFWLFLFFHECESIRNWSLYAYSHSYPTWTMHCPSSIMTLLISRFLFHRNSLRFKTAPMALINININVEWN